MINPSEDLSPDEAQMLAEALRQFNDQLRKLLEKLTQRRAAQPGRAGTAGEDGRPDPDGQSALPRVDGAAHEEGAALQGSARSAAGAGRNAGASWG